MKICYFGIFKEDFTRSRVIIKALNSQGIEVIICTDHTPSLKKYVNLIKKHNKIKNSYDVMLVGFPGYFVAILACFMTFKPIIFDAYISYYDGLLDRHNFSKLHPRLLMARAVDYLAGICSDVVLTINEEYRKFFISVLKVSANKMEVLHKGADETIFYPNHTEVANNEYRVLWWGSYIPLHGVSYIIEAANILRNENNIHFHLIGGGQLKLQTEKMVDGFNLSNMTIHGRVSEAKLLSEIRSSDIALGIFNDSPKAMRCVTNKVYEAIASGKAVITEDSPANREIFTDKKNVYFVLAANAPALAFAIKDLLSNKQLRNNIAKNAHDLFLERFTTEKIGLEFIDIMKRHGLYKENHLIS